MAARLPSGDTFPGFGVCHLVSLVVQQASCVPQRFHLPHAPTMFPESQKGESQNVCNNGIHPPFNSCDMVPTKVYQSRKHGRLPSAGRPGLRQWVAPARGRTLLPLLPGLLPHPEHQPRAYPGPNGCTATLRNNSTSGITTRAYVNERHFVGQEVNLHEVKSPSISSSMF